MLRQPLHKGRSLLALAILFAVIGLVIYSKVILHGVFLYDDFEYIVDNPIISDISTSLHLTDPRQIGYLSFALNNAVGGENPFGYHLVNVAVHIINSLLVFALINSLLFILNRFRETPQMVRYTAFLTALLFLVHPAQTQAVSYVTQRFTSLATLFYLLAVWGYLRARTHLELDARPGKAYALYAFSFGSALLAMKTKEISFTIPVMLFLLEGLALKRSRFSGRRFLFLIPFAALSLIIPLSLLGPELGILGPSSGIADLTRTEKLVDLTTRPVLPYLFTQFRVIVVYVRTLLFPVGLRAVYDFPVSLTFFDVRVISSLLLLAAVAGSGFFLWRKGSASNMDEEPSLVFRLAAIGIFWFFITLSVESSVIPIKDVIFEHRMYLPSVGFLTAVTGLLVHFAERFVRTRRPVRAAVGIVLCIAVPLAAGTYVRNDVWTDEVKLWDDVVAKSPEKAIGYNNRGMAYARRGEFELALRDLDQAIRLFPKSTSESMKWENADMNPVNMSKTYTGRGDVYIALGDTDAARKDYRMAKKLVPVAVNVDERLVLADRYAKRGAYKHAIEEYNKILQWEPEHIEALNDRANAYSYLGRYREAIRDLTRVIGLDPEYVLAYHNRGIAFAWTGKKERAVADFKRACAMGFAPSCDSIEIARSGGK